MKNDKTGIILIVKKRLIWCFMFFVFTVFSFIPVNINAQTEVSSNAKVIDSETLKHLTIQDNSILIFDKKTPVLEAIKEGDILVMGISEATPHGLLRKVKKISEKNGQIIFYTTQAALTDAIKKGEIHFTTNSPEGIIDYKRPRPEQKTITYKDREGNEQTVGAYPGLIVVSLELTVSQNDAKALFESNGGKIVQQTPKVGLYFISVTLGSEAKFITTMYKDKRVRKAFPNSDFQKALELIPDYATVAFPDSGR